MQNMQGTGPSGLFLREWIHQRCGSVIMALLSDYKTEASNDLDVVLITLLGNLDLRRQCGANFDPYYRKRTCQTAQWQHAWY